MTVITAYWTTIAAGGLWLLWWEHLAPHGMRRLYFRYRDRDYIAVFRTQDDDGRPIHRPVWQVASTTDKAWQWTVSASPYPEPEAEVLVRLCRTIDGETSGLPDWSPPAAVQARNQ